MREAQCRWNGSANTAANDDGSGIEVTYLDVEVVELKAAFALAWGPI